MKASSGRTILRTAVAAATLAVLSAAPALAAPAIGQPAPDFTAQDSKGKQHKLSDFKGRIVVLEWTNHECPYVQKHYKSSNMQGLQKGAAQAGAVWLNVISSAPGEQGHVSGARADELVASQGAAPAAVLLDPKGEIGKAYDARTTPHMYVIDARGVLRYAGGIDSIASTKIDDVARAQPLFKTAFESVVKGEDVKQPVTRPYGCGVKYTS